MTPVASVDLPSVRESPSGRAAGSAVAWLVVAARDAEHWEFAER